METGKDFDAFVFDPSSGLYYHASSQFYHDPSVGWYYSSKDGLYYRFEDGKYVPWDSTYASNESDCPMPQICIADNNMPSEISEITGEIANDSDPMLSKLAVQQSKDDALTEELPNIKDDCIDYPLWHYDLQRLMYWYYDRSSNAYYLYEDTFANQKNSNEAVNKEACGEADQSADSFINRQELQVGMHSPSPMGQEENCYSEEKASEFGPGWVEDFAIELYLKGYSQLDREGSNFENMDQNAMVTHLEDDSNDLKGAPTCPFCDVTGTDPIDYDDLEEGEILPELELRRQGECTCSQKASNVMSSPGRNNAEGACILSEVDDSKPPLHYTPSSSSSKENSILEGADDHVNSEEIVAIERWQAQYGQVVRQDEECMHNFDAINLWNWRAVSRRKKAGKKRMVCLIGQIIPSLTKLHPSLQISKACITTADICEVDLDLVKVSSGEIYRLRQPSSKYLATLKTYDSSNPTRNWKFPRLCLSSFGQPGSVLEQSQNESGEPVVMKPFVPNLGHLRYRHLATMQKPKDPLRALTIRTPAEVAELKLRSRKYKDRAKVRREFHNSEAALDAADSTNDLSGSDDFPVSYFYTGEGIGPDVKARQMMENMGWSQGQGLGKTENGCLEPIRLMSNAHRTGLGWK